MKHIKMKTQKTRSLATRFATLAAAAPWRRSACLATLAPGLGGFVSTAQATLLLYELFAYTAGDDLSTKSGGTGFDPASSWSAVCPGGATPAFVKVYTAGSTSRNPS